MFNQALTRFIEDVYILVTHDILAGELMPSIPSILSGHRAGRLLTILLKQLLVFTEFIYEIILLKLKQSQSVQN